MDLKRSDLKKIKKISLDLSELRELKPISFVDTLSTILKDERFRGLQGIPGRDGKDGESIVGPQGPIGHQGIPGERGESIVGPKGDKGEPGIRGSIWFSGSGKPSLIAEAQDQDFYLDESSGDVYKFVDKLWIFKTNIKGPEGQKGRDGKDGRQGPKGEKGERGVAGKDGKNGLDGKDGKDGKNGFTPAHEWSGTKLRFENVDGSWGPWVDLRGVSAKFVRGASQTIINNNGGGSGGLEIFTKTVGPGGTVNLDQFVTADFRQAEYFLNILNLTDLKSDGLKLFVLKADTNLRTEIYARTGREIPVVVDASFSGLNTNVFLTNNSLNTLELKYSRLVI